ncbi:tetracycline efflux protein [Pseudozyma hubeiensis SY62]|uniref:Tetracycline efflux protein n=1 Tax=Pseudozyma hubeiensis (strain SY62) TaxID=1305764 RepID=R9P8P0_PSEHS|nr:tetracycline efflux protein [Pseudozyma hubeiensis SY62]GAC97726.1 tetracycline efflux protein [Pseudozyma hubeiensis SY62]
MEAMRYDFRLGLGAALLQTEENRDAADSSGPRCSARLSKKEKRRRREKGRDSASCRATEIEGEGHGQRNSAELQGQANQGSFDTRVSPRVVKNKAN